MAKMIPAMVPEGTPYSERRIFELLRLDPDTEQWTILHSLGLRRTRIGPYGEIDFVALVPGQGIVCLEVKGGEVSCKDGVWRTRNRKTGQTKALGKSPYMQAREGMFELLNAIQEYFGQTDPASSCPVSYAVVFPDVHAPPATTEAEAWETIDIGTLRSPISKVISHNISASRKKLDRKFRHESFSLETLTRIRQFLRPDFDVVIARSSSIRRSEEQIVSLTEEQYGYLDIASVNERVLVTGAAGTGKTLLALEFARREVAAGREVLLLCYNRILSSWLRSEIITEALDRITAGTFHSHLRGIIERSSWQSEFAERASEASQSEIFQELFPFYAELALGEQETGFDTLIVDEAQDLLSQENLALQNAMVRGGLAGGRWAIFGDFTRQAIYANADALENEEKVVELVRQYNAHFPIVPLRVNCRNTKQIGEETALLSGFKSLPYKLAHVEGLAVDYRYWKDRNQEVDLLETVIRKLLKDGVDPLEIVILSPNRFEKSAALEVSDRIDVPIADIHDIKGEAKGCIVYSTIHSFKGMESPVVILCGFSDISSDEQRSLLYVGMSRARSHLVLILGDRVRRLVPELTAKRLLEEWGA